MGEEELDEQEFKEMHLNAMRWQFFREIITGSDREQGQAQVAMAVIMRGEQELTPALVDAAMDAAMESFGVRTKLGD